MNCVSRKCCGYRLPFSWNFRNILSVGQRQLSCFRENKCGTLRSFCSTATSLGSFHTSKVRLAKENDEHKVNVKINSCEKANEREEENAAEKHANKTIAITESSKNNSNNEIDEHIESVEEGFKEEAIIVKDEAGNYITRIHKLPLTLIEEVPLPVKVLTEIELLMMAWCEEHARRYRMLQVLIRLGISILVFVIVFIFYKTRIASERRVRGVANVPPNLRIGSVVYFDISENGVNIGRVVIGLFTEDCPLYCEYFHRKCTGSGGNANSFRGMRMTAIFPNHCLLFGEGREMTHDVPGFNAHYLPTEHDSAGGWRGALSAISYGQNKESPNFAIHVSSGDYTPEVFGMVIAGYDVIERINRVGCKHGNAPKREYIVTECGELCTLAKSHIIPMPWRLYESVSSGYDEEKFGKCASKDILSSSDERGLIAMQNRQSSVNQHSEIGKKRK